MSRLLRTGAEDNLDESLPFGTPKCTRIRVTTIQSTLPIKFMSTTAFRSNEVKLEIINGKNRGVAPPILSHNLSGLSGNSGLANCVSTNTIRFEIEAVKFSQPLNPSHDLPEQL